MKIQKLFIGLLLFVLMTASNKAISNDILWANYSKIYGIGGLNISADGNYFAVRLNTDSVRVVIYDLKANKEVWSDYGDPSTVLSLSSDGKYLARYSSQGYIVSIIDWQANKEIFNEQVKFVIGIYFTPDGKKLILNTNQYDSTGLKHKMFIYGIEKQILLKEILVDNIYYLKCSKDVSQLYLSCRTGYDFMPGNDTNYIGVMNINTGEFTKKYYRFKSYIGYFEINPDETKLVTFESKKDSVLKVQFRDLNTGIIESDQGFYYKGIYMYRITQDFAFLVIEQDNAGARFNIIDLKTHKNVDSFNIHHESREFGFAGKSNVMLYILRDELRQRNIETKQEITLYDLYTGDMHTDVVLGICISPDKKYIASGSGDTKIKIWDAETGAFIKDFTDNISGVSRVRFTDDGKYLMSASNKGYDAYLRFWEISSGKIINEYKYTGQSFYYAMFDKSGELLVFSSYDSTIYFVNTSNGKIIDSMYSGNNYYHIFLSDSKNYFAGGWDSLIIWKNSPGGFQFLKNFGYFSESVYCLDISPDDQLLVYCAGSSGDANILNMLTWDTKYKINGSYKDTKGNSHSTTIGLVKFSPDSKYLFVAPGGVLKVVITSTGTVKHIYMDYDLWPQTMIEGLAVSDDNSIIVTHITTARSSAGKRRGIPGVENESATGNMEVYPNPAGESLNIKSLNEINSITITDMLGKTVKLFSRSKQYNYSSFDVSFLRSGVYLVSAGSGKNLETIKFIKE